MGGKAEYRRAAPPSGFYERSRPQNFERKVREIDDIFDDWASAVVPDPSKFKVSWRAARFVPSFAPPANAIGAGCAVALYDGLAKAYICKTAAGAIWVNA
jgi:hypothetical protein